MFDLQAEDGSVRRRELKSPVPQTKTRSPRQRSELDGERAVALQRRLLDHYTRELDRQAENRREMSLDEDFYDNEQWSADDKAVLEARGQKPLVYNVTATTVDWVLGSERRARSDYKLLARRKKDSKGAERKSQLLKYLSDVNNTPFHWSTAFADGVKVGLGWMEAGIRDDGEDEPLYERRESWRHVLHDSNAQELDLSDARYQFRAKWVDLDVAKAIFKNRKGLLDRSVEAIDELTELALYGDDAMDSQELDLDRATGGRRSDDVTGGYFRQRVRIIECWYRMPVQSQKMIGGQFSGEIFDETSRGHAEDYEAGEADVQTRSTMRMHVALFTPSGMLWMGESPYRHNRFPLTPIWGFRRGRNNLPYGLIRRIRGIQEDINKRASKALSIMSNNRVVMDEGAVDDLDEFMEEVARPDGLIVKKFGKSIEFSTDRELSQYQLEMMGRSISMVQQASGVTDELMGRGTNARSGIAIQSRQDQGQMATSGLFDNLRFAKQIHGGKLVSLTEQFITEKKSFRITNMRGNAEYVDINDDLPENDITRSKADYVISEADWRASLRQAQADELFSLLAKIAPVAPQIVLVMLDLLVESMDLPNRDELVRRIRQATGMTDPDQEEPTPEDMARQQQQQQAQQFQQAMAIGNLEKLQADIALIIARAKEIEAKTTGTKVQSQKTAMDAAAAAVAQPGLTHVADHMLGESGFRSRSDLEAEQMEAAAAAARAQQPQTQGATNGLEVYG